MQASKDLFAIHRVPVTPEFCIAVRIDTCKRIHPKMVIMRMRQKAVLYAAQEIRAMEILCVPEHVGAWIDKKIISD